MKRAKSKQERFSWKTAALKLARCVVMTIRSDGKIGVGSGLVMHRDAAGKVHIERWDKDFIEALAYIGIEVVEKPKATARQRPATARHRPATRAASRPGRKAA